MSLLKIITWPAKVLETRAKEVAVFDDELKKFVLDMHETMHDEGGIGLAANQVNVLQRVLVIHIPFHENPKSDEKKEWWHDQSFTFINPEIIEKKGQIRYMEGCLSFPDIFDYVDRSSYVKVKAQNERGESFEVEAEDLFAICLQHEIDHIDGIVFINRMSRLKSKTIKQKIIKRAHLEDETKEDPS